jgi:hypothetical protein
MNTKNLANLYSQLSVEERFRLIVAACDRGDDAERHRLKNASQPIILSFMDYSPHSLALHELATAVLLALLEDAAQFNDAHERWHEASMTNITEGEADTPLSPAEEEAATVKDQLFQLFLAQGFMLRTNAAGWKLFCGRMGFSPFSLWHKLPGVERLQRHLKSLEATPKCPGPAFTPTGMARWLNRHRPEGTPEATAANILSAERIADSLEAGFREHVKLWGG